MKRSRRLRENLVGYLFLLPYLTVFVVFMLIPVLWTARLSFYKGDLLSPMRWAGLSNYTKVFSDEVFLKALWNTVKYMIMVIPSVMAAGLALAALLNTRIRFRHFFRVTIFMSQLAPVVLAAIIWQFLIQPKFGALDYLLHLMGVPPVNWLGSPQTALLTITLLQVWQGVGFYMITYLAAIGNIPAELFEAARIDGATEMTTFFRITLPLLRPTLLFTSVMATIWNLQLFDSVYVLTQGGPVYSTTSVVWYIYQNTFRFGNVGFAATMAVVLMAFILLLTLLQFKVGRLNES